MKCPIKYAEAVKKYGLEDESDKIIFTFREPPLNKEENDKIIADEQVEYARLEAENVVLDVQMAKNKADRINNSSSSIDQSSSLNTNPPIDDIKESEISFDNVTAAEI